MALDGKLYLFHIHIFQVPFSVLFGWPYEQ